MFAISGNINYLVCQFFRKTETAKTVQITQINMFTSIFSDYLDPIANLGFGLLADGSGQFICKKNAIIVSHGYYIPARNAQVFFENINDKNEKTKLSLICF